MFTIYNVEERKFQLVEEPNPSLSYTYADYLQWKFEEQVELIRGKIFKMSPAPAPRHQQISIRLSSRIFNFLEKKKCQVFTAPFDVRLPVKKGIYNGAKIYAGKDSIKSTAVKGLTIQTETIFTK